MTTPRARARAQTMADILRIGREHLATDGAAALSLRAVARDLGVVSSAVYRYVRSRDELLTLLVIDGYDTLGDTVDAALATAPDDPVERLRITARTVRSWALAEPAWYGLLFGTPVPGYAAPADRTVAPGTRIIVTLLQLVDRAYRQGLLTGQRADEAVAEPLGGDLRRVCEELELDLPDWVVARALTVYCSLFGAVNADVFDMYGADTFTRRDQVFEVHIGAWDALLGVV
ncbi:TetR/AcrR family transcriptional regulator [Nocardia sp. NPDC024068]|uniref:TetR/AcrR family transcriptional regulator n=1 Tax=Nocardia sp. NPDC024068 TaxID=3157197 RepID=UPI0033FD5120